jgi:hypothetical protein
MKNECPSCGKCEPECQPCVYCDAWKCEHHEFQAVKRPAHCVCDRMEWGDPTNLPPVCSKYMPSKEPGADAYAPSDSGRCAACEHDKECHTDIPAA